MMFAKVRKLCLVVLCALLAATALPPAGSNAISGSLFDPGHIIDDVVFYDYNSMSESQIQSFLNSKVPSCDNPGTCLKDDTFVTHSKSAESGTCSKFTSPGSLSAAQIIYDVSHVCKVNPKSLIVLLQKEEGLVTDTSPSSTQYRIATGYGCPDSATSCDSQYYGFFNQVYSAARQYRRYRLHPTSWAYVAGRNNSILYNPRTSCGSKTVYIDNQATAGLYDYTPYVPNKAALDAGYGTGNSCSSYGNRNFWLYFNDWFGTTQGNVRFISCSSSDYLIERGIRIKRLINADAVTEWGLDDVNFASGDRGCSYPTYSAQLGGGSGADSMVIRSRDTGAIYLVDTESAYQISGTVARAWGITGGNKAYPEFYGDSIHLLNVKHALPRLAKSSGGGKVYLLDEGKLHCVNCTGTGNGGVSSSTLTIKLITASGSTTTFSNTLINDINTAAGGDSAHDTTLNIGHAFKAHAHWYYFDYGKVHMVKDSLIDRWNKYDPALPDSPQLSMDLRHALPYAPDLRKGYRYGSSWYYIDSGGNPHRVSSAGLAKAWGVYNEPRITSLLQRAFGN